MGTCPNDIVRHDYNSMTLKLMESSIIFSFYGVGQIHLVPTGTSSSPGMAIHMWPCRVWQHPSLHFP